MLVTAESRQGWQIPDVPILYRQESTPVLYIIMIVKCVCVYIL